MTIFKRYPRVVLERCDLNKLRAELGIEIGEVTSAIVNGKVVSRENHESQYSQDSPPQSGNAQDPASLQSRDVSCSLSSDLSVKSEPDTDEEDKDLVKYSNPPSVDKQKTDDTNQLDKSPVDNQHRPGVTSGEVEDALSKADSFSESNERNETSFINNPIVEISAANSLADQVPEELSSACSSDFIVMPIKTELDCDSNDVELSADSINDASSSPNSNNSTEDASTLEAGVIVNTAVEQNEVQSNFMNEIVESVSISSKDQVVSLHSSAPTLTVMKCEVEDSSPKELALHEQRIESGNNKFLDRFNEEQSSFTIVKEESLDPISVSDKVEEILSNSVERKLNGSTVLFCKFCSANFRTRWELLDHLKFHTGKDHLCPHCPAKFTSKSSVRHHSKVHFRKLLKGDTRELLSCKLCSARFTKKRDLVSHSLVHSGVKPFSCHLCPAKFTLKCNLSMHSKVHNEERFLPSRPSLEEMSQIQPNKVSEKESSIVISSFKSVSKLPSHDSDSSAEVNPEESSKSDEHFSVRKDLDLPNESLLVGQLSFRIKQEPISKYSSDNTDSLLCKHCSHEFESEDLLASHTCTVDTKDNSYPTNVLVCPHCPTNYTLKSRFLTHLLAHSNAEEDIKIRPFSCGVCSARFKRSNHLTDHMSVHTGDQSFHCRFCSSKFSRKSCLMLHLRTHSAANFKLSKPRLLTSRKLLLHRKKGVRTNFPAKDSKFSLPREQVNGQNLFACAHCPAKYVLGSSLQSHLIAHSKDALDRPYPCQLCSARYFTKFHLEKHMMYHTGKHLFRCVHCPAKFALKHILRAHMESHSNCESLSNKPCEYQESDLHNQLDSSVTSVGNSLPIDHPSSHETKQKYSPFSCTQCPAVYRSKIYLTKHMKKHEDKTMASCELCPAKFSRSANLWYHLKAHSADRQGKPYSCPLCSACYKSESSLKGHMLVHSGQYPFRCSQCPAKFCMKRSLSQHMRSHSTNRDFLNDREGYESKNHQRSYNSETLTAGSSSTNCPGELPLNEPSVEQFSHQPTLFSCTQCPAAYTRKLYLVKHMKKHGEKFYPMMKKESNESDWDGRSSHSNLESPLNTLRDESYQFVQSDDPSTSTADQPLESSTHESSSFMCTRCPSAFRSKIHLAKHMMKHSERSYHRCSLCPSKYTTRFSLMKHFTCHSKKYPDNRKFACSFCFAKFKRNSDLISHTYVHTGQRPFSCNICSASFRMKMHLSAHKALHCDNSSLSRNSIISPSSVCEPFFSDQSKGSTDLKPRRQSDGSGTFKDDATLTNEPSKQYLNLESPRNTQSDDFDQCNQSDDSRTSTADHPSEQSPQKPSFYRCSECPAVYTRRMYLIKHMKKHEDKKPNHICPHCPSKYSSTTALAKHSRCHSNQYWDIRKFACSYCTARFRRKPDLIAHTYVHTGQRPFACSVCPASFRMKLHLVKHEALHRESTSLIESNPCRQSNVTETLRDGAALTMKPSKDSAEWSCKNRILSQVRSHLKHKIKFRSKSRYAMSLGSHACEKFNLESNGNMLSQKEGIDRFHLFTCTHCPAKYMDNKSLVYHLKVHSKEAQGRRFACRMCSARFTKKYCLDRHMIYHTGEHPFACTVCPARFCFKWSLGLHMKSHSKSQSSSIDASKSNEPDPNVKLDDSRMSEAKLDNSRMSEAKSDNSRMSEADSSLTDHPLVELQQNEKLENEYTEEYLCPHCPGKFAGLRNLKFHLKAHLEGKETRPFCCRLCTAKFKHNFHLKEHMMLHTGKYPFKCSQCPAKFRVQRFLTRHLTRHLNRNRLPKNQGGFNESDSCEQVSQMNFESPENKPSASGRFGLRRRSDDFRTSLADSDSIGDTSNHSTSQLSSYPCTQCPAVFTQETNLFIHMKNHEKQFYSIKRKGSNESCDRESSYSNFDSSLNSQSDEDERAQSDDLRTPEPILFRCSQCPATYHRKNLLKNHLKTHLKKHVEESYDCSYCPSKYKSRVSLLYHSRCHSNKHEGDRQFTCLHCSAKFKREGDLKAHTYVHTGQTPFSCSVCSASFRMKANLAAHEVLHRDIDAQHKFLPITESFTSAKNSLGGVKTPYSCRHCTAQFLEKTSLEHHESLKHASTSIFRCPLCPAEYPANSLLKRHLKIHKPHDCKKCTAKFWKKSNLLLHLSKYHTNQVAVSNLSRSKPKKLNVDRSYACKRCPAKFSRKLFLYNHLKSHEKSHMKKHNCTYCSAKFCNKLGLLSHLNRFHNKEDISTSISRCDSERSNNDQLFACEFCPAKYSRKLFLYNHLKTHSDKFSTSPKINSSDNAPNNEDIGSSISRCDSEKSNDGGAFACEFCPAIYSKKLYLCNHLKSHSDKFKASRKAKIADKFKPKQSLASQFKVHRGKNDNKVFACKHCGKKFHRWFSLNRHKKLMHAGDSWMLLNSKTAGGARLFPCPHCPSKSLDTKALNVHLLVHTDDGYKPHACNLCSAKYRTKDKLENHMRVHNPDGPTFSCPHCLAKFFTSWNLSNHLRIHQTEPCLSSVS